MSSYQLPQTIVPPLAVVYVPDVCDVLLLSVIEVQCTVYPSATSTFDASDPLSTTPVKEVRYDEDGDVHELVESTASVMVQLFFSLFIVPLSVDEELSVMLKELELSHIMMLPANTWFAALNVTVPPRVPQSLLTLLI